MKKLVVLVIVVLAISLGLTACAAVGGDLKLVNDTDTVRNFSIYFDGVRKTVNDGQTTIMPGQKINAHSDENTSYAVFISKYYIGDGAKVSWSGSLSGGETVELKISALQQED